MENLSDDILIAQAKSGDESSLDFLMQRYKQLASKIARSYFLIGAEHEDLLQEAMIGLYKAYINYNQTKHTTFSTFAYLCITRSVQDAVKSANSKKHQVLSNCVSLTNQGAIVVSNEEDKEVNIIIPSKTLSPVDQLIEEEKIQEIKTQIKNKLSGFEQKVLKLYLEGDTYTQISQKLNTTNKSIDNALSRIRGKLCNLKVNI
ncbi:MAG: sigma-70 family RNA polymerase sigma factor [Clostridia bacterium]|nr:sigma-70 family RNA polymerase sigma factor [Clostridia bacterium]